MLESILMRDAQQTMWVQRGKFEHKVWWFPGYDCRQKCQHEVKGEHGQHGDELLLAVRLASYDLPLNNTINAQFGLTLEIMTYVRDGKQTIDDLHRAHIRIARGYGVTTHHPYPTQVEEIREARGPNTECEILACGQCYSGYSGMTAGDLLWTPKEIDAIGQGIFGPELEHQILHLRTDVWTNMEAFLLDKQTEALASKAALPVQCPHCKGEGVVPLSSHE
jgi:hypothetical protein